VDCCQCQGIEAEFNQETAAKQLRRYRENGPAKTTVMLTNALTQEGVEGMTLLDIGGGIGAIQPLPLRFRRASLPDWRLGSQETSHDD
jgi:magnesium-protoporphyrin O-methyltransferase